MFNDRSEAEAAAGQLRTQIGAEARIIDQTSGSSSSSGSGSGAGSSGGFWSDLKEIFVSDSDRPSYEEGVRRGHFMLCANVPEDQADRACNLIEQAGAVDLDENEQQWRSEGWSGGQSSQSGQFQSGEFQDRDFQSGQSQSGQFAASGAGSTAERGNIVEEERIPVVQEQLRVGKREIERGGARVRSYVEERPATEQVTLREEHVNVERRPVDQPISSTDLGSEGLLQEREIEMRETAEQAIVGKEARVTEEVIVQKTADQRTEQVQDTVRNTNVEVDQAGRDERGAMFESDRETTSERSPEFDPSSSRH